MRAIYKQLFLLLLAGSLTTSLHAQSDLRFERITVDDGLPQNSVRALLQDHLGFLWFATQDGLVKYDGYQYTIYQHQPGDTLSLSPSDIFTLHEGRDGTIWVGSARDGLNRFDRKTETFTHFRHDPNDPNSISSNTVKFLHEDKTGKLWVYSRDAHGQYLDRLDPGMGEVKRLRPDPNNPGSLRPGRISDWGYASSFLAFCEDRDGIIWIGLQGDGGLNRFDPLTETFTHFLHDPNDPTSISSSGINDVYEDRSGNLWIATYDGLNLMDRATGTFTVYRHDPNHPDRVALDRTQFVRENREGDLWVGTRNGLSLFDRETATFRRYIHDPEDPDNPGNITVAMPLLADQYGDFWFKTYESRYLSRYDSAADQLTYYRPDPNDPSSISIGTNIEAMLEDRSGVLWIGTWVGGLNKLDRSNQKFPSYRHDPRDPNSLSSNRVRVLYEAPSEPTVLWIGTGGGGLNRLDQTTGRFTNYRHDPRDPNSLSSDNVRAILEDHEGILWIGTGGGGLNRLDQTTGRFTNYRHDPRDPNSLSSDGIWALYEDPEGELWIGAAGRDRERSGLQRFDRGAERFIHYSHESARVSNDHIYSIHADSKGGFWIATNLGGFQHFDPETERFTRYKTDHRDDAILSIYEDRAGRLWIASFTQGLGRFDRDTGTLKTIPGAALARGSIYSMLEDDEGYLWINTDRGLSKVDPEAGILKTYDVSDGLPSNRFPGVAYRGADGTMYFGGSKGFIAFHPDQVRDNPNPPVVGLTDFSLFDEPVSVGEDSPLKVPISIAESITLRHNENDFSFGFSALHYSSPEKNQYAYLLEGYDIDWREVGTQRQASYMNLDPGTYTFRVKASNNDGLWNEEGASIDVIIKPPWWQTTWAYVLYGLLFIAGIISIDRLQRRRLIRRERQRAEIEQAELREKAAKAVAEIATSQAREAEAEKRALQAENERKEVELEKAHELEVAYHKLRTTQDQLILAEKMASLGALTAGIAHEIKNPLNFVNNFAQINQELADELNEALDAGGSVDELKSILSELKQGAEVINKQGKRADAIVKSMMEHASGGSGQREPTDVNTLVEEYFNLAYHGFRAHEPDFTVKLERDYGKTLGEVEVVPQEIGRVLINLMNNAFYAVQEKASKTNGDYVPTVRVVTEQRGEGVVILVEDNGGGISVQDRAKIFEPFYTTKPTGQGNTGLGLSLSYDIVVQGHGGTLTVESEEGEGATFIITLPT